MGMHLSVKVFRQNEHVIARELSARMASLVGLSRFTPIDGRPLSVQIMLAISTQRTMSRSGAFVQT